MTLDYEKYGRFLIMGTAGFISSTVSGFPSRVLSRNGGRGYSDYYKGLSCGAIPPSPTKSQGVLKGFKEILRLFTACLKAGL